MASSSDSSSSSCLSCLFHPFGKKKPPSRGGDGKNRGGGGGGRRSVYDEAVQSKKLNSEELEALRKLEEEVVAARGKEDGGGGPEASLFYFDAEEGDDEGPWGVVEKGPSQYAPATCSAAVHPRTSVAMDMPETMVRPAADASAAAGGEEKGGRISRDDEKLRSVAVRTGLSDPRVRLNLAGYPGELTETEFDAARTFRSELKRRAESNEGGGSAYREMVDIFKPVEEEPYALCRYLRARKFDVDQVFELMEENLDTWNEGKSHDFYPEFDAAIGGMPPSVLLTQFPFLYHGNAKNGCPVTYFKAGKISVEGIDCVTDFECLSNVMWHCTKYQFPAQVAAAQKIDPDVVRCEAISLVDLDGLSATTLNSRTLDVLKNVIRVNSCVPEVLNCMAIVNAPYFFSYSWKIIRTFLDERTASKINLFSDRGRATKWLLERIDESELLEDYGGKSLSFDAKMRRQGGNDGATKKSESKRQIVELMYLSGRSVRGGKNVDFELSKGETVDFDVYTRIDSGAVFALSRGTTEVAKANVVSSVASSGKPFRTTIAAGVAGPGKFRVSGGKSSAAGYFLVIGRVY